MAQHAHVPKFGNWEADGNAPYTAFFNNARVNKKVGGKMVNPNDPSENPEAFAPQASPLRTGSDPSVLNPNPKPRDRDEVRVNRERANSDEHVRRANRPDRSPLHPGTNRNKVNKYNGRDNDLFDAGSAVPKFGDWDKDPSSAEGYTDIFEKVREEKQTGSSKSPMITSDAMYINSSQYPGNYKTSSWSCFGWCK